MRSGRIYVTQSTYPVHSDTAELYATRHRHKTGTQALVALRPIRQKQDEEIQHRNTHIHIALIV